MVEFAFVLPVTLLLMLGIFEFGRAFVFGVAVQNGAREAARLAATADYDGNVSDATVLGRVVNASVPALLGCAPTTSTQVCGGGTWNLAISVSGGGGGGETYSSVAAARAGGKLAGSQVTITARGSVALLPGLNTGMPGLTLPTITVQGQSAMVVL